MSKYKIGDFVYFPTYVSFLDKRIVGGYILAVIPPMFKFMKPKYLVQYMINNIWLDNTTSEERVKVIVSENRILGKE